MTKHYAHPKVKKSSGLSIPERVQLAYDLAHWRARHGYTREAAAAELGIPLRTGEHIENGHQQPVSALLKKYLALLDRVENEEGAKRKPLPLLHTVIREVDPAPAGGEGKEPAAQAPRKQVSYDRSKPLPRRNVLARNTPLFEG